MVVGPGVVTLIVTGEPFAGDADVDGDLDLDDFAQFLDGRGRFSGAGEATGCSLFDFDDDDDVDFADFAAFQMSYTGPG